MYTNIDMKVALNIIPEYLKKDEKQFSSDANAFIAALHIMFGNNLF